MAIISARKKADGSISYRAEIRIKRKGKIIHRESATWDTRKKSRTVGSQQRTKAR